MIGYMTIIPLRPSDLVRAYLLRHHRLALNERYLLQGGNSGECGLGVAAEEVGRVDGPRHRCRGSGCKSGAGEAR